MAVPTTTNDNSSFFVTLMDDKNLITQAQVAKTLFFLQIRDIIQALFQQRC